MRTHLFSRSLRAGLAVIVAAAATASLAAVVASPASAATPRCTVPNLKGSFTNPSAGAGQRFITLALKNTSKRACSMSGYPGAQLLAKSGRRIPTHILHDHSRKPKTIVLRPGQSARSAWHYTVIAARGEPTLGVCAPIPSKINVTPPNATDHLTLRWGGNPVCDRGAISVRPMTK